MADNVPEGVQAVLSFLKRMFPDGKLQHREHFDSGDWIFDLYIGTDRYPRRLIVTEERLTDEESGQTVDKAVTVALKRHEIADQLRRQPQDRELVFAHLGLTTQERRARQ